MEWTALTDSVSSEVDSLLNFDDCENAINLANRAGNLIEHVS